MSSNTIFKTNQHVAVARQVYCELSVAQRDMKMHKGKRNAIWGDAGGVINTWKERNECFSEETKQIVGSGSGSPRTTFRTAAIGLECWGKSLHFPLWYYWSSISLLSLIPTLLLPHAAFQPALHPTSGPGPGQQMHLLISSGSHRLLC